MRVVLLTNTISGPGGAEHVAIAMFNSLRELNNVIDRSRLIDQRYVVPHAVYRAIEIIASELEPRKSKHPHMESPVSSQVCPRHQ